MRPRTVVMGGRGAGIKHRARSRRFAPLRHADYRRLWSATFISELGDAMGRVALTVLIHRQTGSAVLTGSVLATAALPHIGIGQWVTAKIAHLPRRRVLVAADVIRALCYLGMTLPLGVYPRLGLLLAASFATPPFNAVASALAARSVPRELIGSAAGLRTGTTEFAFILGFAIGGVLADLTTPVVVIAIDAATFVISAVIVSRLGATEPIGSPGDVRFGDGLRAIRADAHCRRIVLLTAGAFALVLPPEILAATYTDEIFPDTVGATGFLTAIVAVGVIVATTVARPVDDDGLLRHAAVLIVAGGGVSAMSFAGPNRLALACIGYAAIGPVLAVRVHSYTVLGRRIDDLRLAPAISVSSGALMLAHLVAGLGGGLLADAIGADQAFTLTTACAVVLGAASLLAPTLPPVRTAATGSAPPTAPATSTRPRQAQSGD